MSIKIFTPGSLNEIGKRSNNEDNIYPEKGLATSDNRLLVVCDGMGGHENGEMASEIVCKAFSEFISPIQQETITDWHIAIAFDNAQKKIDEYIAANPSAQGMGTTLTLVKFNNKSATVAHCGDSRVYQIRDGKIIFKTEDHSLVNELLRNGIINEQEAENHPKKNVITRALQGTSRPVKADVTTITDILPNDYFFLCTDGILESISDKILCDIITANSSIDEMLNAINSKCLENSKDNYSCYLVKIESAPALAPAAFIPPIVVEKPKSKLKNNKILLIIALVSLLANIVLAIYLIIGGEKDNTQNSGLLTNDIKKWEAASKENKKEAYEAYVKDFEKGIFINIATEKIKAFDELEAASEDSTLWSNTIKDGSEADYELFRRDAQTDALRDAANFYIQLNGLLGKKFVDFRIGKEYPEALQKLWIAYAKTLIGENSSNLGSVGIDQKEEETIKNVEPANGNNNQQNVSPKIDETILETDDSSKN